jgi:hypothetical protein
MRAVMTAVMIALLTGPAYSQANNLLDDGKPPKSEEERLKEKATDDAYKSATNKIPSRKPVTDPWGDVRGAEQKPARTSPHRN